MATDTLRGPQTRPLLDRTLDLSRINLELLAYVLVMALSVVAHLWGLGVMAMHHDESVHAFPTWNLYRGSGGFSCYGGGTSAVYCYDPVYHGPTLYYLMLGAFFLFGDGEAQARLPMALAGMLLVASCWLLRPYLGRRGALLAAVLLGFAPSLLYYTRFARHDALMLLWELWMVIGFLGYVGSGRPRYLYLLAAAVALAMGTHELYYILFFIFGLFVLVRGLAESRWAPRLNLGLLIALGICALLMVFNPPVPVGQGLFFGDKAMLISASLLLLLLVRQLWDPAPVLLPRLRALWFEQRRVLWTALAVLAAIYVLLYSSFFAYPRGIIDGLYAGLAYWLGSQQAYARGDQPWYYYLMLLPLYEPLALVSSLAVLVAFVLRLRLPARRAAAVAAAPTDNAPVEASTASVNGEEDENVLAAADAAPAAAPVVPPPPALERPTQPPLSLTPLLLLYWFFSALVIFSWAGEKMPWLVVHMALPGNLLAAWALARLSQIAAPSPLADASLADSPLFGFRSARAATLLLPGLMLLLLLTVGVALWRFGVAGQGQAGQSSLLQGIIPLALAVGLLYAIFMFAERLGRRRVLALAGLTLAAVAGVYMLRASWLVVYDHPDTPVEPLIYVQTAPGIPLLAQDMRELAINQTRNQRTSADVTGGLTMPMIIDSGDPKADGEGSLAWPLQWYFRDFQRINWRNTESFRDNPSATSFDVDNNGVSGPAPVVLLYKPHVTEGVRQALEENYVQRYQQAKLNWWFPEGDKCQPTQPGYKRFYFSSWTPVSVLTSPGPKGCGAGVEPPNTFPAAWAPLLHPFQRENWTWLAQYLLYRKLPDPLTPSAREMEVWVRKDLAPAADSSAPSATGGGPLRLLATQTIGEPGQGEGQFTQPSSIAVDSQGNVYVADTFNHRIQIFDAQGNFMRAIGERGGGEGQFIEPRGIAVDAEGNIYVADTWNARIVKLDPDGAVLKSWGSGAQDLGDGKRATITEGTADGNIANPLGFFGPRGLALDDQGNLYIADTGNKRIVVTDTEGNLKYQWGFGGADAGAFNEPTGVAVDAQGNVYVADTWNGRVQVFSAGESGQVAPVPVATWQVSGWRPNTYDDPSIAASPDGKVFASLPANQTVLMANLRGDVGLRWGGAGTDQASLNAPSGMAVAPDGSVYVVDRAGERVLRFVLPEVRLGSE